MLRRPGASWPNGAFASGSGHPASAAGCRGPTARQGRDVSSEFDLFRDAERVLDLDPEIADRAFQLRVAEQKLNRSQVPRLLIDLRGLRPPHRMCPVAVLSSPTHWRPKHGRYAHTAASIDEAAHGGGWGRDTVPVA